jgi:hypothetical protein
MSRLTAADFVGAWLLKDYTAIDSEGNKFHPFGADASGMIMYTATGYMSVLIAANDLKDLAKGDLRIGTDEEWATIARNMTTYSGTYRVGFEDGSNYAYHSIERSIFPNFRGTVQKRKATIEGDVLTLSAEGVKMGGKVLKGTLQWQRRPQVT